MWHLDWLNSTWNTGSIRGAEAVRKLALAQVTVRGPVGILVDCACIFIGAIWAICSLVAEELLVDAVPVAALELLVWADRFICLQVGKGFAGLC